MEQYRHESRRPGGVYLSIDHPEAIGEAFKNFCADADDIDLILATDAELILGIGDWGVGGIEVAIGKLAVYTAAGGIDPARVIPVMLDVGTNRDSLLNDPMYIGNRHPRVRGKSYDDFIDAYVTAASKLFPHALLHWAGLGWNNGRRILDKYSDRMCMFDDEIQGAGAITLAAAISAARVCGAPLRNQRVVIFGDGCLNTAIADPICGVMMHEGLSRQDATRRFWFVDKQGLLIANAVDRSRQSGTPYARPAADVKGWKRDSAGGEIDLSTVVRQVQPTMLIGASASSGAFTEAIVKAMAAHTDRPIIFPLSTSASLAEATPSDLLAWTDGRALIATGSSFSPVTHKGITYVIGQVSNTMLYPGLGLGTIVSRARRISDGMIRAAANAVSSLVAVSQAGASLLPQVDDLRSVSAIVAVAVAEAAAADGLAGIELTDIVQQVQDAMWLPEYGQIDAA